MHSFNYNVLFIRYYYHTNNPSLLFLKYPETLKKIITRRLVNLMVCKITFQFYFMVCNLYLQKRGKKKNGRILSDLYIEK